MTISCMTSRAYSGLTKLLSELPSRASQGWQTLKNATLQVSRKLSETSLGQAIITLIRNRTCMSTSVSYPTLLAGLYRANKELTGTVCSTSHKLTALNSRLEGVMRESAQQKLKLQRLQTKLEDTQIENKRKDNEYLELNVHYSNRKNDIDNLKVELDQVKEELTRKMKDLNIAHDGQNDLKEKISELEKCAARATQQIQELKELKEFRAEVLRLAQDKS